MLSVHAWVHHGAEMARIKRTGVAGSQPLHAATAWLTSLELAGLSTTTQGDDDQHCDRCQSRESQSQSGESQSAHLEHVRGDVRGDRGDIPVQSGRSRTVTSTNWIQMRPPTMAATVRDPRERDPLNGQVASRRRSAGSHDHGELVAVLPQAVAALVLVGWAALLVGTAMRLSTRRELR
jgi:hypothetical protein